MITRRTHILKCTLTTGEPLPPYQDDDGNWHYPEAPTTTYEVPCRVEVKTSPKVEVQNNEDQKVYNFSYQIFLNTVDVDIPIGTEIEAVPVKSGSTVKGNVSFFSRDQRQCRIWV